MAKDMLLVNEGKGEGRTTRKEGNKGLERKGTVKDGEGEGMRTCKGYEDS